MGVEAVVAGTLRRVFIVRSGITGVSVYRDTGEVEPFARTIIKVVLRIEMLAGVVSLAEILHALRPGDASVLACDVIGHEVHEHLHACRMGAGYECLELCHACVYIHGNVGVDVVVVGDGIRRPGTSLHDPGVLARYAESGIVRTRRMADDAGKPEMGDTEVMDALQHLAVEVVHLPRTVLLQRSVLLAGEVAVAEGTGENLVDN